jgi:hypothetical protein
VHGKTHNNRWQAELGVNKHDEHAASGNRYIAKAVPNGAPTTKAQTLAVTLTSKESRTIPRKSRSKLASSSKAILKAEEKSLILQHRRESI